MLKNQTHALHYQSSEWLHLMTLLVQSREKTHEKTKQHLWQYNVGVKKMAKPLVKKSKPIHTEIYLHPLSKELLYTQCHGETIRYYFFFVVGRACTTQNTTIVPKYLVITRAFWNIAQTFGFFLIQKGYKPKNITLTLLAIQKKIATLTPIIF